MKLRETWIFAALASLLAAQATAQSRGEGWEAGAQLIYQDSQDVDFNGGTSASLDDDIGVAVAIALTPYVTALVGWSFIDTNIPNAPPQNVCWWDPWFGPVCGTFQSTRTIDEFAYSIGAGLRWDVSPGYTVRLGYEKRWLDLGAATSTPDFDLLKLGVTFRY